MSEDKEEITTFKILLLGDSEVGKTSFILRFCEDTFKTDSLTTIGLDTKTKFIKVKDKKIQLIIWDTAGEERFKTITKNTYKGAHGILLMFALNKRDSFKAIKGWINNIKEGIDIEKVGLIVIGNKSDLSEKEKEVDEDMIEGLKEKEKVEVIEASAKDNVNVNESFIRLVEKMLNLGIGQKASFIDDDEDNDMGKNIKIGKGKKKKRGNCCANNNNKK